MLKRTFEGWNEQNHAVASRMWSEDRSAAEIGECIGATRNAVSGYMSRNRDAFPKKTEPTLTMIGEEIQTEPPKLFRWNAETIAIAIQMYADMATYREMARKFGCETRTVEKFIAANSDMFPIRDTLPKAPRKVRSSVGETAEVEVIIFDPSKWRTLPDLESHDCRWIMEGNGASALFCAETTVIGYSWCRHHYHKAFRERTAA